MDQKFVKERVQYLVTSWRRMAKALRQADADSSVGGMRETLKQCADELDESVLKLMNID